jgi:hypothetical protein
MFRFRIGGAIIGDARWMMHPDPDQNPTNEARNAFVSIPWRRVAGEDTSPDAEVVVITTSGGRTSPTGSP